MKGTLFLFLFFIAFSLSAQQSKKIADLRKEQSEALTEIEEINNLLKENTLTIKNALSRLDLLSRRIESRKKIISLLNQEIAVLDEEITSKEKQIKTLENNLQQRKEKYAASIRKMYSHRNNQDHLLFILSAQNLSQSFRRILYLKEYSGWQKTQAKEITDKQKAIRTEKAALVKSKNDKLALLEGRKTEEKQLSDEESVKKAEIKTLDKNKKKLQKELAVKQKQAEALNKHIEKFIAEETTKSKKAAQSPEDKENRVAETKDGYAMTKSEQALSSNFAGNRGKLPFPLKGNYKIVGYFGVHQHKELSNIATNNLGIEIETTPGNEARAVFNGVVSRIFIVPGFNNSIIVRHGNYLTLYSYLEQVYVKQGDQVKTGQALGKIYTDKANGNSTVLHFELWKEQNKLNPLLWLNK